MHLAKDTCDNRVRRNMRMDGCMSVITSNKEGMGVEIGRLE